MNNTLRFYFTTFVFLIPITMHAMEQIKYKESGVLQAPKSSSREDIGAITVFNKDNSIAVVVPFISCIATVYTRANTINHPYKEKLHLHQCTPNQRCEDKQTHCEIITALGISPSGSDVITGSLQGNIVRIWDITNEKLTYTHQFTPQEEMLIHEVMVTNGAQSFSVQSFKHLGGTTKLATNRLYTFTRQ